MQSNALEYLTACVWQTAMRFCLRVVYQNAINHSEGHPNKIHVQLRNKLLINQLCVNIQLHPELDCTDIPANKEYVLRMFC